MTVRTTIALALALSTSIALVGCSGGDGPALTSEPSSSSRSSETPTGGTIDSPTVAEATPALLEWKDAGITPGTGYVRTTDAWAHSAGDRSSVDVAVDGTTTRIDAGSGRTISEVLMSTAWAVVVKQDRAETAPSQAVVIDLATGGTSTLAGPSPASGGSWALTDGDLYYPTYGDDEAYCLATSALADSNGEDGWCAPEGSGFSGLTASEHGIGLMTFDDARPAACRTVNVLDDSGVPQPVEGPQDCTAWDVAAVADGAVWSDVPQPRRQEEAHFYASAAGTFFDLGPGTTGSAVPCGDSVFFVRDPQGDDEPARLMRWTPDLTLEVAYESSSVGNAFLGEPACGGDVVTVASFGEELDEQVWAATS